MVQITGHKADSGWWDGPERFERVNRNMIASTQRETIQETLMALFDGQLGLNIGASGCREQNLLGINIDGTGDIFADARELPFEDNLVSYIYCNHSLEHMRDPDKIIMEWIRVLKPGGIFYNVMPDKRYFKHGNQMGKDDPYYAPSEMTADELRTIMQALAVQQPYGKTFKELLWNTRNNNFDFNYMGKVVIASQGCIEEFIVSPWKTDSQIREELGQVIGTDKGWGGWTSEKDRYFLVEWLQKVNQEFKAKGIDNPQIAEVGVFMGGTSMMFLTILENSSFYAIDNWSGGPYDPYPSLKDGFLAYMKYFLPRITIIDDNSKTLMEKGYTFPKPLDLLYIDGDHHYEWAKRDIDYFIPFVKPGGYILIDDFQVRNEVYTAVFDAKLFEKHLITRWPSIEVRWDGMIFEKLLVFQKKGK